MAIKMISFAGIGEVACIANGVCQTYCGKCAVRTGEQRLIEPEVPFSGVEEYYRRLFAQICQRREDNPPLGTGGDLDCLIAMVKWLWKRHVGALAAVETQ